jgi:CRP/FNR family transcriptional regulator, cyclic AMP receptor protein
MTTLSDCLKKSSMFAHLSDPDLNLLEASMTRRRYTAGQVIFHMGDEGGSLYLLAKGRVKVAIPSPQGDEVILAILSAGEILGELSLIDGKPRSATVEAIEETEVFCLRREDFLQFLGSRFDAVLHVLEVLAQRLRETDASLAEAHFLDLKSRLSKKIIDLAGAFGVLKKGRIRIGVRITQKDLASMVGATRESINKQLMQLRQLGLVELADGYMTILDPVRMARRARTEAPHLPVDGEE